MLVIFSRYARKDKIVETKVIFTVQGQKTLVAGKGPIKIRAYDPRFNGDDGGWIWNSIVLSDELRYQL